MTSITDSSPRIYADSGAKYFYFYMALACVAVAFIGFAPTYWAPMASGKFKANPIIHIHGLVFFCWTLFFAFQTWLAASGRIVRHRAVGMVGISFATAMTIFGVLAAINSMKTSASMGLRTEGIEFAFVPFIGIAFFALAFVLAVSATRRPETHKRLMLLATIAIMEPAVARWFVTFLAPAGAVGPPPVAVTIPPALVAYLLVVVAMVFDWRTRGRPHSVYVIGGAALVAMKLLSVSISRSELWHSFAGGILALAQ